MARADFYDSLHGVWQLHGAMTITALAKCSQVSKAHLSHILSSQSTWPSREIVIAILAGIGADAEETARVLGHYDQHTEVTRIKHADQASLIEEIRLLRVSIDRLTAAMTGQAESVPDQ